jgi:prolyl-tRNA synthetase
MEDLYGENVVSVDALKDFLGLPVEQCVKTLLYTNGESYVAAAVRGDYELNEEKLRNAS